MSNTKMKVGRNNCFWAIFILLLIGCSNTDFEHCRVPLRCQRAALGLFGLDDIFFSAGNAVSVVVRQTLTPHKTLLERHLEN